MKLLGFVPKLYSACPAAPRSPGIARCFLPLSTLTFLAFGPLPSQAQITAVTWGNTGTNFNAGASWVGGIAPGLTNRAVFDSTGTLIQPDLSANFSLWSVNFLSSGWTLSGTGGSLTLVSTNSAGQSAFLLNSSSPTTATIDANVVLGGGASTTQTFQANLGNTLIVNGVVSSTNSITLALNNPGTFLLNGGNTYTGTTQWNSATSTTILGHKSAFGASTINFNQSNTIKAGADLTGSNKLTNTITLAANTKFKNDLGYNLELGGAVNLGGAARAPVSDTGTLTFSGVISNDGGGGLTLSTLNNGAFVLSGANTYTGATTISGDGQVTVSSISNSGSAGNLGSGSTIHLGAATNAGSLVYDGSGENTNRTVNLAGTTGGASITASGSGALVFTGMFTATGSGSKTLTLAGASTAANEIKATIGDNSSSNKTSVLKSGTGTWILSGANTYTGGTTISFGTLRTSHVTALGAGPVTVSGGTSILDLAGTTIANAVDVQSGGRVQGSGGTGSLTLDGGSVSPGNSPGTMTAGATTFGPGGSYTWEINSTTPGGAGASTGWDLLSISGALTITSTSGSPFTIHLTSLMADNSPGDVLNFNASQNSSYTIATASGGIGSFSANQFTLDTDSFSSALHGGTWSLTAIGNDLNLNFTASAIPEPSTYAAIAGVAALALAAWRRRRNRTIPPL